VCITLAKRDKRTENEQNETGEKEREKVGEKEILEGSEFA